MLGVLYCNNLILMNIGFIETDLYRRPKGSPLRKGNHGKTDIEVEDWSSRILASE